MTLRLAIQPDLTVHRNNVRQSYSERWAELAGEAGVAVKTVDMFRPDWLAQLDGCDAFMWRCSPPAHERLFAKRLVQALEHGMKLPTFPAWRDIWHYNDKIAQVYLLAAAGIATPENVVLWDRRAALEHCRVRPYPFVFKLAHGYQSANVVMVRNHAEAAYYIDRMFGSGLVNLGYGPAAPHRLLLRRLRHAASLLRGGQPDAPTRDSEVEHGFFYAQEFLPGNQFDTRVTIIGERAFAFRRANRPGDFRASGSGLPDWAIEKIDMRFVRLAYQVARALDSQIVAIDGMYRGDEPVVTEINLTVASWLIVGCPGHWTLAGSAADGDLVWHDGPMRSEDAIFADFLARVAAAGARAG